MFLIRNCLCLNSFISVQGIRMSHLNHPWIHPRYSKTVTSSAAHIVADSYLWVARAVDWSYTLCKSLLLLNVQYTELLRNVPLIIASGHSMESINNVHVFLLTFYLCSLFQQWMHQDFASQSKCNTLVTSSAFRCAFKELFFSILFYTIIFNSQVSSHSVCSLAPLW